MIYYSHPIAGVIGAEKKDYRYENENCKIAIRNVKFLRSTFPQVLWYCPGEVEIPLQVARQLNLLSIEQVLQIDFYIMKTKCSGTCLHRWEDSMGVDREKVVTIELGYPYIQLTGGKDIQEYDLDYIQQVVRQVQERWNLS